MQFPLPSDIIGVDNLNMGEFGRNMDIYGIFGTCKRMNAKARTEISEKALHSSLVWSLPPRRLYNVGVVDDNYSISLAVAVDSRGF
jgi:hypothetical protein